MGDAQSRYVKQSVPPLSPVWAAVFPDRALIITMYTTLLDYDKSRRMAFQTFPAVLGQGERGLMEESKWREIDRALDPVTSRLDDMQQYFTKQWAT